jgi:hypothetical protein
MTLCWRVCLLLAAAHMQIGLASWCVAVGPVCGSEETPPTCRIAVPLGQGESLGNGAETKRPPPRIAVMRL